MSLSESEELELLQLQKAKAMAGQPQEMGGSPPLGFVAKQVFNMTQMAHPVRNLPLLGAMVGSTFGDPGTGAAAGAGAAQIIKDMAGIASGDPNAPRTAGAAAMSAGGQALGAGIMQEPQVLKGIPGVSKVTELASGLVAKMGKGAARFGEALTGAKAKDLEQAAKQGLSTYKAPSMEEAQNIFGRALKAEGIASKRPLEQIIDPQLSNARDVAITAGKKFEDFMGGSGVAPTVEELLRGRQAVDRIYNATPLIDRSTRAELATLRTGFDDMLSTVSGKLGEASKTYRQSIVKSNILNPFRITKQGQMSAVAPMIATLAASAGLGSGHKGESGLGALGYLAASSPLIAGLAATSGGSAAQAINSIAQNPAARQALLQVFQRLTQKKPKS